jgi:hypothetical protein
MGSGNRQAQAFSDLTNFTNAINSFHKAKIIEIVKHWRRLSVVGVQSFSNRFRSVVRSLYDFATTTVTHAILRRGVVFDVVGTPTVQAGSSARETWKQVTVRHLEGHHGVQLPFYALGPTY